MSEEPFRFRFIAACAQLSVQAPVTVTRKLVHIYVPGTSYDYLRWNDEPGGAVPKKTREISQTYI